MKIGILQLSDIHIKKERNSIYYKIGNIHSALQDELYEIDHLFILITGDTAFSGKSEEYNNANDYLNEIISNINSVKDIKKSIVIIPGNHDCDFESEPQTVRNLLLSTVKNGSLENIDDSLIDQICVPQKPFFDFVNNHEDKDSLIFNDKLFKIHSFELGNYNVVFNCINSSWVSERKEVAGTLYYPIERYEDKISSNKGDLIISLLHHPYNWYPPINTRRIKDLLESNSDLIMTGHEHVSSFSKKDDFQGNVTEYIEGGVLQESSNPVKSEFNFIKINLSDKVQKIIRFSWVEKKYYSEVFNSGWISYDRCKSLNKRDFQINKDFSNYLNDPGITINHPRKTSILLEDVYIYPDAKVVQMNEKADKLTQYVSIKDLMDFSKSDKYLILGGEKSGKTAFSKILFNYLYNAGYVPVLLNGSVISKSSLQDFQNTLYKTYNEQYSKDSLEMFRQFANDRKVIIIDDLDKSKLNNKYTFELIKNISSVYKYVVLFGDELFRFSDLITEQEVENSFNSQYEKYELMEFGHLLRSQFVEKWNLIGQIETASEDELEKKHDKSVETINTIIGNNYVPSYPFFLIVILQTIESGLPHNLKESSYGYYYDLLILQSLSKLNMKHEEIDAFYNFVTELANRFFNSNVTEMSEDELKDFYKWFSNEYDLTYDFEKNTSKLLAASLLERFNNVYRFKYKYIYYYFVAKYLSIYISEIPIRDIISTMCSKAYIEEYANIIMFLTHLSKDPFILNELYTHAQKIFKDIPPAKLENDIDALNSLVEEVPKMVYENIEVKKHREEKLKLQDEMDRSKNEVAVSSSSTSVEIHEEDEEMDLPAQLNLSFKTIEMIGQILKNYYGSIKADEKYILCEEAYMVGLRSLNSFLSLLTDHMDSISSHIYRIMEQKAPKSEDRTQVERKVRKFLFSLCCAISHQSIQKVADSVGSENLYETFKKITNNHPTTAVKLIEISIKLDQSRSIPFNDINTLKNELENNVVAYTLLRSLVVNHMYMFNTNFKSKQRICDLLGISIKNQRSIELLSHQKK